MPEPGRFLLVALSGRALAVAASRAGRRARVVDLFGDTDTRALSEASLVVPGGLDRGFDEAALLEAADRLAPPGGEEVGLVYGSGLEGRPDLIARLGAGRHLYGNSPETVARTKDPATFFGLLDRLGLPHPEITLAPPDDPEGWLVKRAGAAGGGHVAPASDGAAGEGAYWQRRVPGRPVAAAFLADGRRARLVGFSEQWAAPGEPSRPFRFGGALQPAAVHPTVARAAEECLDGLVAGLGLVGLNSLDLIVAATRHWLIEVNPRPGASLDVFDRADPVGLFARHLRACEGDLPGALPAPLAASAMAVVYAERAARVPPGTAWPDWVADRPAPGALVDRGAPVCTVLIDAPTAAEARRAARAGVADVLARLEAVEG